MTLLICAFAAAVVGALSGLGGGVFLMPILVQIYGAEYGPASLASISLSLVLVNALSALLLGGQIRNVDFAFARPMAVASAVGALAGVWLQSHVARGPFELYLSVFLLLLGVYILWRSPLADSRVAENPAPFQPWDGGFSLLIGTVASFFGVGGGVLQVPYMVYVRHRAVRQATATSQAILGVLAVVSLLLFEGVQGAPVPWRDILSMTPVVVVGGVLGSRIGRHLRGPWIVRILALVLLFLAYRVSTRVLQLQG